MARYEHLPIFRMAFDLAVHVEKIVRNFSRYHKYTLGTDLRDRSREIVEMIIAANTGRQTSRKEILLKLRGELECFKVITRLCHESGGFQSTRAYLYVSEQAVNIAKQNEGWLKQTGGGRKRKERRQDKTKTGPGQNCQD